MKLILRKLLKNNSVIRYLLALSLILGALIVAVGISGIAITQKLSNQVEKVTNTAFGPALAFDEIINGLNVIEIQLLKSDKPTTTLDEKAEYYKIIKTQLDLISTIKNEQLLKAENQDYSEYLIKWDRNWSQFRIKMTGFTEGAAIRTGSLDKNIIGLRDEMNDIRDFIKYDVVVIMENSSELTKWSMLFLSITLMIGVSVALTSSSIIVRQISKLFDEIDQSKKSVEVLFDNLDEGFFMFDKSGTIRNGVSSAARKIFGKDLINNKFVDVLPLEAAKKKQALAWQELAFSGIYDFDDFKSVAPRSIEMNGRFIELDFRPVYTEDQILDRVICISIDKTNERKLRLLAEEETSLVKLVLGIIKDRAGFSNDVLEIRNLFLVIIGELTKPEFDMSTLLRAMHTVKGCAATRHILTVAKLAHSFETKAASYIAENGLSEIQKLTAELMIDARHIESVFESFMKTNGKIFEALMGKESFKTKTVDIGTVNELCRLLLEQNKSDSPAMIYFVEHFMKDNIVLAFNHYAAMVRDLAASQKKQVNVKILNSEFTINPLPYTALLTSLTHIFTNAVDHGIESASERVKCGKPVEGTVTVSFKKNMNTTTSDETLLIQISDDGRGINWEKVRDRAINQKRIPAEKAKALSQEQCLQLIFMNSFSTAEKVSQLSGRGVGTDAVMHEAQKLGGRAWVKSQLGRGTSFFIEVPNLDSVLLSETIANLKQSKVG